MRPHNNNLQSTSHLYFMCIHETSLQNSGPVFTPGSTVRCPFDGSGYFLPHYICHGDINKMVSWLPWLLESRMEHFWLHHHSSFFLRTRLVTLPFYLHVPASIISLGVGFLSSSRILHVLRVLHASRSLRSISTLQGLQTVMQTVIYSIPGKDLPDENNKKTFPYCRYG